MNIYSVKQVNTYVKNMFTQDFLLNRISVRGEISNCKDHPSGHIYFTLKDADSVLSGVMFAGSRAGLKCRLREGMKVIVTGSVSVYEAGGKYQLYAKQIEADGEGDLYREFLKLKERLQELGLFDASFKRPIPKYARTVGIVTAESGAALQDIRQIAYRRNPYVQLILSPAAVQGEQAAESIVRAIQRLDALHPDVMIVGRGGGSMEDLWCFNDERVAQAIFDADTPIISAVGHEVDFTIADFVADLRAPTPSAAAELAVFDLQQYLQTMDGIKTDLQRLLKQKIDRERNLLKQSELKLRICHPANQLNEKRQRITEIYDRMERLITEQLEDTRRRLDLTERLERAAFQNFDQKKRKLEILTERLEGRSPLKKLTGGYGYIETDGKPLKSIEETAPGRHLSIVLSDGRIESEVLRTEADFGRE